MERRTLIRRGLLALPIAAALGSGVIVLNNLTLSQAARSWPIYKNGNSGEDVYTIQYLLRERKYNLKVDGIFGPKTAAATRKFQQSKDLEDDGVVDPLTWEKLVLTLKEGNKGNAVKGLQQQLNYYGNGLVVDGIFGPKTANAVKDFKNTHGLSANKIAGLKTWHKLVADAPADFPSNGSSNTIPASENSSTSLPEINSFNRSIEGYARYVPQTECASVKPGVKAFCKMFLKAFPGTSDMGMAQNCSVKGTSEHKDGRAWDWGVNAGNPKAEEALRWLLATDEYGNKHAMVRRLGIMYIIYNRRIWSSYRADEGWRSYTGANPHTDHIHFSFSLKGANGQTSFWAISV